MKKLLNTLYVTSEDSLSLIHISIPAILQNMWIRLVKEDLPMAGDEEIELLYRLEKAGLVEVDESETHLYLSLIHIWCLRQGLQHILKNIRNLNSGIL